MKFHQQISQWATMCRLMGSMSCILMYASIAEMHVMIAKVFGLRSERYKSHDSLCINKAFGQAELINHKHRIKPP